MTLYPEKKMLNQHAWLNITEEDQYDIQNRKVQDYIFILFEKGLEFFTVVYLKSYCSETTSVQDFICQNSLIILLIFFHGKHQVT